MNRNRLQRPDDPERRRTHRAPLSGRDLGLHRTETTLFLVLVGAVGSAFLNVAETVGRFAGHLPEFAALLADLFRSVA